MPDEIVANEMCAEVMRDCALTIANFRNRMNVSEAAFRAQVPTHVIRAAIESGEIAYVPNGKGTKRHSYQITPLALAEWIERTTVRPNPLPHR